MQVANLHQIIRFRHDLSLSFSNLRGYNKWRAIWWPLWIGIGIWKFVGVRVRGWTERPNSLRQRGRFTWNITKDFLQEILWHRCQLCHLVQGILLGSRFRTCMLQILLESTELEILCKFFLQIMDEIDLLLKAMKRRANHPFTAHLVSLSIHSQVVNPNNVE